MDKNLNSTSYAGDLHPHVTEFILFDLFSKAGSVKSIRICKDRETKKSLGYAYFNFATNRDAENALESLNFEIIMGRPVRLMWSQRNPALRKSSAANLFVKNLHRSISSRTLYDVFSVYGRILSCKLVCEGRKSKGFGYVQFEKEISAKTAIQTLNGMTWNGQEVYVTEFKTKNERQMETSSSTSTIPVNDLCILDMPNEDICVNIMLPTFSPVSGNDCISTASLFTSISDGTDSLNETFHKENFTNDRNNTWLSNGNDSISKSTETMESNIKHFNDTPDALIVEHSNNGNDCISNTGHILDEPNFDSILFDTPGQVSNYNSFSHNTCKMTWLQNYDVQNVGLFLLYIPVYIYLHV